MMGAYERLKGLSSGDKRLHGQDPNRPSSSKDIKGGTKGTKQLTIPKKGTGGQEPVDLAKIKKDFVACNKCGGSHAPGQDAGYCPFEARNHPQVNKHPNVPWTNSEHYKLYAAHPWKLKDGTEQVHLPANYQTLTDVQLSKLLGSRGHSAPARRILRRSRRTQSERTWTTDSNRQSGVFHDHNR